MAFLNPKVSFVTSGRNDTYRGNFLWRLETTLNYIGREVSMIGRPGELEFVVVDWGSEIPLHKVLHLGEEARKIARFLIVPPEVAALHNEEGKFPGSLAINAGVRRARGRYIAQTGGDVLYDKYYLADLLDLSFEKAAGKFSPDKTLFLLSCKNVPQDIVSQVPDLEELGSFIGQNREQLKIQPLIPFLKGGAAAFLMHRDLWAATQGLDEAWIGWGWTDCDLKLRVCLRYGSVDYGIRQGLFAFHLDHPSFPVPNQYKFNPFTVNGPHWGLGDRTLTEFPPLEPFNALSVPEAGPVPENSHFWGRHFLNLLMYLPTCRDYPSLRTGYLVLNLLILGLPGTNLVRRLYVRLKRLKDSLAGP